MNMEQLLIEAYILGMKKSQLKEMFYEILKSIIRKVNEMATNIVTISFPLDETKLKTPPQLSSQSVQ